MYYAYVSSLSRKAKAARSAYETLRTRSRVLLEPAALPEHIPFSVQEGFQVPQADRHRILNLRLQDEHYSPYIKSDMSLFHLLMMDDRVEMSMFRADGGWLLLFDGIQATPQPFGTAGHDMR